MDFWTVGLNQSPAVCVASCLETSWAKGIDLGLYFFGSSSPVSISISRRSVSPRSVSLMQNASWWSIINWRKGPFSGIGKSVSSTNTTLNFSSQQLPTTLPHVPFGSCQDVLSDNWALSECFAHWDHYHQWQYSCFCSYSLRTHSAPSDEWSLRGWKHVSLQCYHVLGWEVLHPLAVQ